MDLRYASYSGIDATVYGGAKYETGLGVRRSRALKFKN
jgi:hypothetical protein